MKQNFIKHDFSIHGVSDITKKVLGSGEFWILD